MLTWFPTPYPDELWTSVLARYYIRSGYTLVQYALDSILPGRSLFHKSTYFATGLNDIQKEFPTSWLSSRDIIENHTLYPYYSRFLTQLQKKQAIANMMTSSRPFSKSIMPGVRQYVPENHFWRYCPLCAKEDMEKYGETYWHRIHQIYDIRICPIHKVFLNNTDIPAITFHHGFSPPIFPIESVREGGISSQEKDIAQFVQDLLTLPVDEDTHSIRRLFDTPLIQCGYRSPTGLATDNLRLFTDLKTHLYDATDLGCGQIPSAVSNADQLSAFLHGKKQSTAIAIHLAYFLNMSSREMVKPSACVSLSDTWNQEVAALYRAGWSVESLARKYNVQPDMLKNALERSGFKVPRLDRKKRLTLQQRQSRTESYRKTLLQAVQDPALSIQDIRQKHGPYYKAYAWLLEHDKDWLDENIIACMDCRENDGGIKYDWFQKDKDLLPQIKRYVKECRTNQDTISWSGACRYLKIPEGWGNNLPQCRQYIKNSKMSIILNYV